MISRKTRYSLMALLRLAKDYGKGPVQISDIAQEQGIPQKFLESILNDCKKLGVVQSKMGKSGGYYLIKSPSEIDIASIYTHFEGPISMLSCASEKHYQSCEFCRDEEKCGIRKTFKRVRDLSYEILKNTTLQSLIDDDETTAYK